MDKMMEEGGLTTDGMGTDPVSGNDIPVGSNAEEVRDDVDAKLSEGEYVVPADVVRYFGVGYFEKLRKKAKEALAEMEADGRVGGEPIPTAEEDLSPEEMDELTGVLNMAKGGYVKGYAEGGIETSDAQQYFLGAGMQPQTDWGQYATPGSFVAANQQKAAGQQQAQAAVPSSYVQYFGPDGQIMMIPVDAAGNPLIPIPEGYTKKAAETAQASVDNDDKEPFGDTAARAQADAAKRDEDWFDKFHASKDPLAMATALLDDAKGGSMPGLFGKVAGGADTLSDIGRIRGYAAAIEATNPELSAGLVSLVDAKIKDSGFGIKALESILGTGKRYADMFSTKIKEGTTPKPKVTTPKPKPATPSSTYTQTSSPNAQSAADSLGEMASSAGSSQELASIQRAAAIAQQAADTGQSIASIGQSVQDTEEQQATDAAASAAGASGGAGGQWGMAKGGLVKRPAAKAPKAAKKPTNKKKGLGRK